MPRSHPISQAGYAAISEKMHGPSKWELPSNIRHQYQEILQEQPTSTFGGVFELGKRYDTAALPENARYLHGLKSSPNRYDKVAENAYPMYDFAQFLGAPTNLPTQAFFTAQGRNTPGVPAFIGDEYADTYFDQPAGDAQFVTPAAFGMYDSDFLRYLNGGEYLLNKQAILDAYLKNSVGFQSGDKGMYRMFKSGALPLPEFKKIKEMGIRDVLGTAATIGLSMFGAPYLSTAFGGGALGGAAAGATTGALGAAIGGGDIGKGLLTGAIGGGITGSGIGNTAGNWLGGQLGIEDAVAQRALNSGMTSLIRGVGTGVAGGKSLEDALRAGAISGLVSGTTSGVGGMLNRAYGDVLSKPVMSGLSAGAGSLVGGLSSGQDMRQALGGALSAGVGSYLAGETGIPGLGKLASGQMRQMLAPPPQRPMVRRPAPRPVTAVRRPAPLPVTAVRAPVQQTMLTQRPAAPQINKMQVMLALRRMTPQQRAAFMLKMRG